MPDTALARRDDWTDWQNLVGPADTALLAMIAAGLAVGRAVPNPLPLRRLLSWEADRLLGRAIRLFAPYRQVVTSRLHGALLALLMGKRVMLLDSLTGKSRAYHATWLTGIEDCRLVGDAN